MLGMHHLITTNTLVIVSNYTKGIYYGKWIGGVLNYTDIDKNEVQRKVWIFPIRHVPDNHVKKAAMFVFKDMEDFKNRGKDVDIQYIKMIDAKKKSISKSVHVYTVTSKPEPKPPVVIPSDIVGNKVKYIAFGGGIITVID